MCFFWRSVIVHYCRIQNYVALILFQTTSSYIRHVLSTDGGRLKVQHWGPHWHNTYTRILSFVKLGPWLKSNWRTHKNMFILKKKMCKNNHYWSVLFCICLSSHQTCDIYMIHFPQASFLIVSNMYCSRNGNHMYITRI